MKILSVIGFMHSCILNLSQLLVSCLSLLDKLINPGVPDLSSHGNNNQTHLN